ncbi:MAG TPA: amino acid ABC transporter substrate-binding protein [Nannocystis exedens]|nr:amino acid ABC transporter substrate-binding protein [Nannocystis exedens]
MTTCSNYFARHRIALGLVGLVVASVSGACAASLDFSECSEHADCARFGSEELLRCENSLCVPAQCEDKKNSSCADLGGSHVCGLLGDCVDALTVEGCEFLVLPGDKVTDDLTLIGAIYDQTSPVGLLAMEAFALAIDDFNAATTLGNGNRVGLIACDNQGDITAARDAAVHLAESVGVPALLGPIADDTFINIAKNVSAKMGNLVFTMTPTATAPYTFSDSGVVWRTIPGAEYQGAAIRTRIEDAGYSSALMVFREDNYGLGIYQALTEELDGTRVIPGVQTQSLLSYGVGEDGVSELGKLLDGNMSPDVVVLLGGDEVGAQIKLLAERSVAPKRILTSHAGLRGVQSAVIEIGDETFTNPIEMIGPLSADPANVQILYSRLLERNANLVLGTEAPLAYDAAMTTLLAMRATDPSKKISGPYISQQMGRLISGAEISFGDSAFIEAAVDELNLGNSIDLVGTSGDLNFVIERAEPCSPFIAWGFPNIAAPAPVANATFTFDCPGTTGSWAP